jgi:hypothetical protein
MTDDVVLLAGPFELDVAAHEIGNQQLPVVRHVQADDAGAAFGLELRLLGRSHGHPSAAVDEGPLLALRGFAFDFDFVGRGVIAIGVSRGEQPLDGCLIPREPLRLVVRSMRSADFGSFVPIDAEPAEAVQNRGQRRLDIPLLIGVVDPQEKLPAVLPGEEPVEERRANAADVQEAGGTGSETSADHERTVRETKSRKLRHG